MRSLDERDIASMPTVYAKCTDCDRHYNGARPGKYYGSSFTDKQWARNPTCENCNKPLVAVRVFRVE